MTKFKNNFVALKIWFETASRYICRNLLITMFVVAHIDSAFASDKSVCRFLETAFRQHLEYVDALNQAIKLDKQPRPKPPRTAVEYVAFKEIGPGKDVYQNLNISSGGNVETVTRACGPGTSFFVEGCSLTVKLDDGKILEQGFGGANLVTYKGSYYVFSSWSGDPKTKKYIDRITPTGFQPCK